MTKTLVIGAGGVGSVAVHKMAMCPDVFGDVLLASRRIAKCDDIAQSVAKRLARKSKRRSWMPMIRKKQSI